MENPIDAVKKWVTGLLDEAKRDTQAAIDDAKRHAKIEACREVAAMLTARADELEKQ